MVVGRNETVVNSCNIQESLQVVNLDAPYESCLTDLPLQTARIERWSPRCGILTLTKHIETWYPRRLWCPWWKRICWIYHNWYKVE